MTTETERAVPRQAPATMPVGGSVVAVVPQSVEEIFRVSKGVVQSGLAPFALTGKTDTDDGFNKGVSAVAIVIMAGAELGLPPMVALRSFTAINGRPALYGDGLINVVRRSGRAKVLTVNYTRGHDFKLFVRAGMIPEPESEAEAAELKANFRTWPIEERTGGFCEATRVDTGESKVVIFTVANAIRAGLWQTDAVVEKDVWEDKPGGGRHKVRRKVPNDSPWFRYPERMLGWRAAGFCLRDLFGDVLGGITDDWEAREIAGMVDITPPSGGGGNRPTPPAPPAEEDENQDADESPGIAPETQTNIGAFPNTQQSQQVASPETSPEPVGEQHIEEGEAPAPTPPAPPADDEEPTRPDTSDAGRFLNQIDETLATAADKDNLERLWDELEVQHEFADDEDAMTRAFALKKNHETRVERMAATTAGQGDLLGGQ